MRLTRKQKIEQGVEKPFGKKKWRVAQERKELRQDIVSASLWNHNVPPRKVRLLADAIRGKRIDLALHILRLDPRPVGAAMYRLLLSAISNWKQKNPDTRLENVDLFVEIITINEGPMLKRLRPAPQGRAYRVRKRSNHMTIVLGELTEDLNENEE